MRRAPSVASSVVSGLLKVAEHHGASGPALLEAAGVEASLLHDGDSRVPLARYRALFKAAIEATGRTGLALDYGGTVSLAEVSVVGLIGNACETMAEALAQLNRYGRLVVEVDTGDDVRFINEADGSGLWTVDRRRDPEPFPELTELTFARMICGVRAFAPTLKVHEVHVTHPAPAHAKQYAETFRCPVRFDQPRNAYRIDTDWLTHRIALQPRYAFGILARHADGLLASLEGSQTARGRVEAALLPVLHQGSPSVQKIARELGMSRATLARRLKDEGVTFATVLDALRKRMALDYLSSRKSTVSETAYLVGFSDPAAFSRAFKRWTGQSPSAARVPPAG